MDRLCCAFVVLASDLMVGGRDGTKPLLGEEVHQNVREKGMRA